MVPKIVICASGDGSNFEAIVNACNEGQIKAEVRGLIVNRAPIGALERAERLQIPTEVLRPNIFANPADWDAAMVGRLSAWKADFVILAGFLVRIGAEVLETFPERVINSHPALLPKFGGAGMFGLNVHAAVLEAGETETGVTVHTIDGEYDRGRVIAQGKVPVKAGDTPERLAERVKAFERNFYPDVLSHWLRLP